MPGRRYATGWATTTFNSRCGHSLLRISSSPSNQRKQGNGFSASLVFQQWTRLACATSGTLYFKVVLELDAIPPHLWSLDTAAALLASCCWVQKLDTATAETDLSCFRLTAWTDNPSRIPRSKTLAVAEHEAAVSPDPRFVGVEPYLWKKDTVDYLVIIHIRRVNDCTPRSSSSFERPSDDGDTGHDGDPARGYGNNHVHINLRT